MSNSRINVTIMKKICNIYKTNDSKAIDELSKVADESDKKICEDLSLAALYSDELTAQEYRCFYEKMKNLFIKYGFKMDSYKLSF